VARVTQVTAPIRRSAVVTGFMTTVSVGVMTLCAAIAGALLAHDFGRTAETDGFFTAYGVYILLVLAATAFRVVVLPSLARAAQAGRLAAEVLGYAGAFLLLAVPLLVLALVAAHPFASVLTGGNKTTQEAAAGAIVWLVPAAMAQVYAGLAASALAALDDYGTAAFSFALGAVVALAVFAAFDGHGPVALAWGLAAGGFLSLAILGAELLRRRGPATIPGVELRLLPRLGELMQGVALPLALQGLYVVANRFAGGAKVGSVTSFGYAYLIAAALVALASSPLSLVSSVPLTRRGVGDERAVVHVVSTSWLALTLVAGVAGVFALAGEQVARTLLGPSFRGATGAELGHLVVYMSPWMVASIGVGVTLPLLFVLGRRRPLPVLAVAALIVDVPIEWAARSAFGLTGVALGLAVTTVLVFAALLAVLSARTLARVAEGLVVPVVAIGALGALAFGVAAHLLEPIPAAALGLALYAGLLAAMRPRGLRAAWGYVRALH
jgi:hypothetical protein